MSDYQLSTNPQAAGDFWTQNGSGVLAGAGIANPGYAAAPSPAPAAHSPIKKAHRLLRGRYPLVILLGATGAVVGGIVGFLALPPKYESAGLVAINPIVTGPEKEYVIPMVNMYIDQQKGMIASSKVATAALNDPKFIDAWQRAYGSTPLPAVADFIAAINVDHKANATLIGVAFDDKKKEVAEAGMHAVLTAYYAQHGSGDEFDTKQRTIDFNKNDLAVQEQSLQSLQNTLGQLGSKYSTTDLTVRINSIQDSLSKCQLELSQDQSDYDRAIAAGDDKASKRVTDQEVINEQIAGVDKHMADLLALREGAKSNLADLKAAGYGKLNLLYQRGEQRVTDTQQDVDNYSREFLIRYSNGNLPPSLADSLAPDVKVAFLKQRIDQLEKLIKDQSSIASGYSAVAQQIAVVQADMELAKGKLASDQRTIELLTAEQTLTQSVIVEDYGSEAVLASDKRKFAAGFGFAFGGLLPLGLMLLYGLTENRFRFSDDATAADLSGVTLLGILPNLPDRLSDPQQAGIAAHCVHQIRTMLQISRSNDEPQVIAITSASSGDGKTSLTLALGLSYAACGARTLLIDCDLIAAGLTHRLNVNSTDGILEAVANRALLEYVRTTDIADVAILPVGTTHAHHASTLSPVALRRLLSEAKKHFDLIIVDTGPILGSIEASLVCAAADRTILAVARNQQRPLVEKSIAHLHSIGAQLAGVVFNRAQASDFERSMSGLALRSRPLPGSMNATPGQTSAAKAVAGSFKRAG
jgi:capsular exopolysaccharide synthesis family protein